MCTEGLWLICISLSLIILFSHEIHIPNFPLLPERVGPASPIPWVGAHTSRLRGMTLNLSF